MSANRFQLQYRQYNEANPLLPFTTAPDDEVGDGINQLGLSFEHNNYEHYNTAATTAFEIRGVFFAVVYNWLWKHASAQSNTIELIITDNLCDKVLNGTYFIKAAGIVFCDPDCGVLKVQAKQEDLTLQCFKDTLVDTDLSTNPEAAHDWFSGGLQHPTFSYCKNNGWLYPLGSLLLMMLLFIPIVNIIVLLFGNQWLQRVYESARGCERKNSAPYITTYIQNIIDNCTLLLDLDTVFHTPTKLPELQYATIYYMPNKRGILYSDNTPLYRIENALNWSGSRFMEFLRKRFNLKWRINPTTGLIIRHFDEAYTDTPILDLREVERCCSWDGNRPAAYGDYDFQLDSMDQEGNAARRAYNDIVEFNNPYSPAQAGVRKVMFEDAAVGFRNDGLRSDDISQWRQILTPLDWLLSALVPLQDSNDFVLMSRDNTQAPKIILHDPNTPLTAAKAIKKVWTAAEVAVLTAQGYDSNQFYSQFGETTYFYNYAAPAAWDLDVITPNTGQLFECDNIRLCECRRNFICEYTLPNCDCDLLTVLGIYDDTTTGAIIDYPVIMDSEFIGEIRNIDIDFGSNTIKLKVVPVGCTTDLTFPPEPCELTILSVVAGECIEGFTDVTIYFSYTGVTNVLATVGTQTLVVSASAEAATLTLVADGSTLAVSIENTDDSDCNSGSEITLPEACSECVISNIEAVACFEYCACEDAWLHVTLPIPVGEFFVSVTFNGITYTPPSPISMLDWMDIYNYLISLNLDFKWIVGSLPDDFISYICGWSCSEDEYTVTTDIDIYLSPPGQTPSTGNLCLDYFEPDIFGEGSLTYIAQSCICGEDCPCNPDGSIDITVTWTAVGTSGLVDVVCGTETALGVAAGLGTYTFTGYPADGSTITISVTDAANPECTASIEFELPTCPTICTIEITNAEVLTCEEDAYQVWFGIFAKATTTDIVNMTIDGVTYTPGLPITATDTAALNAYFTLALTGSFVIWTEFASYVSVAVITNCGVTISGADVDYLDNLAAPQNLLLDNSTGILTCSDVRLQFPDFECDNGCDILGEVGVLVDWTSFGTSGAVTVDIGGLGSIVVPAGFGTATVGGIPANGELITVTVCDVDDPLCCGEFELQLPDCD